MSHFEHRAASVRRVMTASPEEVWSVLSDGWLYPVWVVGATRMRDVDPSWPESGARLHHSVGNWPVVINDKTEVLEVREPELLRLRAHAWPGGAAEVLIEVEPHEAGSLITIREDAVEGPALLMPRIARQAMMVPRNRETLLRLSFLAEKRAARHTT